MPGERRTLIVIIITSVMMVVEIIAGIAFGSMALLADGLHMASHAVALAIAYIAYIYARRHARDERFSFGTGKVNSLAGFTGAVLLAVFALGMVWESVDRFLHPVAIQFNQAILVAMLGLVVNAVSALVLGHEHGEVGDGHAEQAEGHDDAVEHAHQHSHAHHHDHNLRSAYLHVIADALTSLLAIFALLAAKYVGATWMDPAMGIIGALLVARWSLGLIRTTAKVLLDHQASAEVLQAVRQILTEDGEAGVTDLHVWAIGPGRYAAAITVAGPAPRTPEKYRTRLRAAQPKIVHATIETQVTADATSPSDHAEGPAPAGPKD